MQPTKNHFAVLRVPHTLPAELLFDCNIENLEEMDISVKIFNDLVVFNNETEIARYYITITGTSNKNKPNQYTKIQSLIINYFLDDYRGLFCCEPEENNTTVESYIRIVSNMTIQERLIQTNQA
jgi:hypothetical protein